MIHRLIIGVLYFLGFDPRGLFAYFDGRRWRYGDPLVMARSLYAVPKFDADRLKDAIRDGDTMAKLNAADELSKVIRTVWNIESAENGGLTDGECCELHTKFDRYIGDLKKNGNGPAITPSFTVPDVSGIDLTKGESDSGSIPTVNNFASHAS